jgi:hypothetical protein
MIIAVAAIILGLNQIGAPTYFVYIYAIFPAVTVIAFVVLSIRAGRPSTGYVRINE